MANAEPKSKWFAPMVWLLRLLTGGVFLVSGFVKGVDLWGFVFKLEEYLAVWGWQQPRSVVVMAALLISGYEFVFGFLLATGCYKRVAAWALTLQMAVMLPLTAYIAVASPVADCGCFGDFLVLSNGMTLVKNIVLTVLLVLLLIYNPKLKRGVYQPALQWMVGAWISLFFVIVALYGYNVQPMIDFRPYPVGSKLIADAPDNQNDEQELTADDETAEDSDDDEVDESAMRFIYERNGVQQEFTIDNLPDSTWTFVDRIEVRDDANSTDFVVYDEEGEDVTEYAITGVGTELLIVIPEPQRIDISHTYFLNELKEWADTTDVRMVCLIAAERHGIEFWKDVSMASYDVYTADDTKLKELVRGTMSVVQLQDGIIRAKYTLSSIDDDIYDAGPSGTDLLDEMSPAPRGWLRLLLLFFGAFLIVLYLFQSLFLAINSRIKAFYQKKAVNLQSETAGDAAKLNEEDLKR
jgi:triosephosphate isomerase